MGDMMFYHEDGTAQIISAEGDGQIEDIVIYCDLCNEPLAITTKLGRDDVYIQCLRCHSVNAADKKIMSEADNG